MCTALCIVDIITESKNILMEFIGILKSNLHADSLCLSFEINRIMKCFCVLIQITDKADDAVRLMILDISFFFLRRSSKMMVSSGFR